MPFYKRPAVRRFATYAVVGVSTLTFDLILLALVVEYLHVPYYVAVPVCFLIAVSINYVLSRSHVFKGTERAWHHGYAYFLLTAGAGAFISTSGVALLVELFGLHYLVARLGVAGFVGMANYLINLKYNFKVMGHHPEPPVSK